MELKSLGTFALLIPLAFANAGLSFGQVQTLVPPVVPGAKPVTVENIKIHGGSLEGNLKEMP